METSKGRWTAFSLPVVSTNIYSKVPLPKIKYFFFGRIHHFCTKDLFSLELVTIWKTSSKKYNFWVLFMTICGGFARLGIGKARSPFL